MIQAISAATIMITSLIAGASGDGLNDKGKKLLGHGLKAGEIGLLLMSPFLLDISPDRWLAYGASYTLIRAAIFDPIYNIARGNELSYVGNSSVYGKVLRAFKAPASSHWFMRTIFLAAGISMIFRYII